METKNKIISVQIFVIVDNKRCLPLGFQVNFMIDCEFNLCMHLMAIGDIFMPFFYLFLHFSLVDFVEIESRFDEFSLLFQLDVDYARIGVVRHFNVDGLAWMNRSKQDEGNR